MGWIVKELLLLVLLLEICVVVVQFVCFEVMMNKKGIIQLQLVYVLVIFEWGEVGGYDVEVLWDVCMVVVFGVFFEWCCYWLLLMLLSGE